MEFEDSNHRNPAIMRGDLEAFARFVRAQSHALAVSPTLIYQQAINQPSGTILEQAAQNYLNAGRNARPWLRWLNPPADSEACRLTLNAFQGQAFHGAFSRDGRQIICADISGSVKLYDANSGANLAMLGPDSSNFHFSPDRGLAVWCTRGSIDSSGETETVTLWDVAAGNEVATLTDGKYEFGMLACASSADGPRIAAGSSSGTLRVWETLSVAKPAAIVIADQETTVDGLVFSPGGTRLLSSDGEGAKLWHVAGRSRVATLSFEPYISVTKFAFSPNGLRIAAITANDTVKVLDVDTATELATFQMAEGELSSGFSTALTFTPDGQRLVAKVDYRRAPWDDEPVATLETWDLASKAPMPVRYESYSGISCFAFSPDGALIAAGGAMGKLQIWDVVSGVRLASLDAGSEMVHDCIFSPDGSLILTCSQDGTLRLWDVGATRRMHAAANEESVKRRLGSAGRRTLPSNSNLHLRCITACSFSPSGTRIVSASDQGTLVLWDAETGKALRVEEGYGDWYNSCPCAFSPDGNQLVASSNERLAVWDVSDPDPVRDPNSIYLFRSHDLPHSSLCRCAFLPEGTRIIANCSDGALRVWDRLTGAELLTFARRNRRERVWRLSPDGARAVTDVRLKTMKVWDLRTGHAVASFVGHTGRLTACAFSPDGTRIVSASEDHSLKLWSAAKGRLLGSFEGHADAVLGCSFSPDGTRIFSGSKDGTLRLWDVATCAQLHRLNAHGLVVETPLFSPDGRWIAAAVGKAVKVWDVTTGQELCAYWADRIVTVIAWSPDGQAMVVGDWVGWLHILRFENVVIGPPVLTAWCSSRGVDCGFGCTLCRAWSEVRASVLGAQIECPSCRQPVELNPFTIDADWRLVARAWQRPQSAEP